MANPEMSSAQEQGLGAVSPQGTLRESEQPGDGSVGVIGDTGQAFGVDREQGGRTLPLTARVLLADLGVAILALIALTFIEVQRMGEASLHLRRQAYAEDLVVLFVVAAVFGVVTFLLFRAGHLKAAIVQAVVTALVLSVAITSAATGNPKPVTVEQEQ